MTITFPLSPNPEQEFVGDNGVTYLYTGDRWSSSEALMQGLTKFIAEGGFAASVYDELDYTLEGGGA